MSDAPDRVFINQYRGYLTLQGIKRNVESDVEYIRKDLSKMAISGCEYYHAEQLKDILQPIRDYLIEIKHHGIGSAIKDEMANVIAETLRRADK